MIAEGLRRVFANAVVHVGHDLDGAAYSTYTGEPAVTCILGTGSNSCMFDGTTVTEEVPALAYILGDEGSGSWFGKRLLSSFLYHKLPAAIHDDFVEQYGLTSCPSPSACTKSPTPTCFWRAATFLDVTNPIRLFRIGWTKGSRNSWTCMWRVLKVLQPCPFTSWEVWPTTSKTL